MKLTDAEKLRLLEKMRPHLDKFELELETRQEARASTLKEVIEIVEGMKKNKVVETINEGFEEDGWNGALDSLKEKIEKL